MLAFALSFDEIIVTTFTAGHERTLPLWLLNQLGRPRDVPVTNVVALLVMLVTTIPILGAWWLTRDGDMALKTVNNSFLQDNAMQHNLLINGELVAGEGEMVPVFNPANGEVILEIAEATEARSTRRLRRRIGPLSAGARRRRKPAPTLC
jgi:hypothetical protein